MKFDVQYDPLQIKTCIAPFLITSEFVVVPASTIIVPRNVIFPVPHFRIQYILPFFAAGLLLGKVIVISDDAVVIIISSLFVNVVEELTTLTFNPNPLIIESLIILIWPFSMSRAMFLPTSL